MAFIRSLPIELAKVAQDEANEVPERVQDDIDKLKLWIKQTPHLKARTDNQFLIAFLRGCKYSMEKAKQKLDLFYSVRQHAPEIIRNRDPAMENLQGMIRQGYLFESKTFQYLILFFMFRFGLPLPVLEHPAAPRIILIRPGIFDPNLYTIQDAMRVTSMMLDILLNEDDNFIIAGQVGVLDLNGVTLQHFLQYNPVFIKKMMVITQDAAPGRMKGLHWINCPRGFDQVFNLFTSFMNEKNRSRVRI
jgi:CRAL/TRIO domain